MLLNERLPIDGRRSNSHVWFINAVAPLEERIAPRDRDSATMLAGSLPVERHSTNRGRMLTGSCGCGRVRYEIHGELLGPITYCHCWQCRKHSGSSFGTTAGLNAADLSIVAGAELLKSWESSAGVHRFFAGCCGSPIYKRYDAAPEVLGFRLGTLDTDPSRTGEVHFMVGSKAPWFEIHDDLPQEPGGLPFGKRG